MWYYQKGNAQQGPIDEDRIAALIASGEIVHQTLVWSEGMEGWAPILSTPLKNHFPKNQPPPIQPPPIAAPAQRAPGEVRAEDIKTLDTQFMAFWICLAAGIPLTLIVIGVAGLIAAVVLLCLMLYRFWDLIQDGAASTTPGKAVGFLFIPFFNFYWNFIALWGLAKDMNAYNRSRNIQANAINEDLILAYCILACTTWIPYLGIVTAIAALVILILSTKQLKEAAQAIIVQKVHGGVESSRGQIGDIA